LTVGALNRANIKTHTTQEASGLVAESDILSETKINNSATHAWIGDNGLIKVNELDVSADWGRTYVLTTEDGPVLTTTTVRAEDRGITGQLIIRGDLISQVFADGGISGVIAVQGNIAGTTTRDREGHVTRLGGIVSDGPMSGQIVVMGNIIGDVLVQGGLRGGRIAVKGDVLGNLTIDGKMDATSALVVGGKIGDAAAGTTLQVEELDGILAAKGNILFAHTPDTRQAAFFKANVGTGNANAAAIDTIFRNRGNPLAFDVSGLDLNVLGLILANLRRLHAGTDGNLSDV
jgi:hypothetical protein